MGAPKRYPPPHKQLGELMLAARREGLSFTAFWDRAMRPNARIVMANDASPPPGAVLWPTDPKDRKEWREALLQSEEGWRRAYDRSEQTGPERAVHELGEMLDELEDFSGLMDESGSAA